MLIAEKRTVAVMSYQKPVNPQWFDEPVYEQMNPKEKVEKKRPVAIRQREAAAVGSAKKAAGTTVKPGAKPKSRPL